jgi:PIN domain nuclease of toxin-antitoxin system
LNLLLDTHIWLWWLTDDRAHLRPFREVINDPRNGVYVSAISVWEVHVKRQIGKLRLDDDLIQVSLDRGLELLDFTKDHAKEIDQVPLIHRARPV